MFFSSILDKFHGDLYLTVKLLLPGVVKSVYNLNDKQIVKLCSRIFKCNQDAMVRDLEQVCDPSVQKLSTMFCEYSEVLHSLDSLLFTMHAEVAKSYYFSSQ